MNTIHHLLISQAKGDTGTTLLQRMRTLVSRMSEPFWFCLSFILFLLTGPFSIIAVLYGLWSLGNVENRQKMIEPARC